MKPYLEENEMIGFLIEWGGLILFLLLILSPFLIIRMKKFQPIRWKHIIGAYLSSFVVFLLVHVVVGKIDRWIYNNFINTHWVQAPLTDLLVWQTLILLLLWPLFSFYSTKVLYKKFNKKRFFIALLTTLVFFGILATILVNAVVIGLGQIGPKYF